MTQRQKWTVTATKIVVPEFGICIFRLCGKEEAHSHPRFSPEGWDLSSPAWHGLRDYRTVDEYEAVER